MAILEKIVSWAKREEPIKALILSGSRAQKEAFDELSDYDISVFCSSYTFYTETDAWLEQIASVWVCIKDHIPFQNLTLPTRLALFDKGIKVDFSFFPLTLLLQGLLPEEFDQGYRIVLDKENLTQNLPKPSFQKPKAKRPTKQEFLTVVEEFWFEAYHVALYLKRKDLWPLKFRSWAMHTFLLRMIEWHTEAQKDWKEASPPLGKKMSSWAGPEILQKLDGIFAHFDAEDSKKGLFQTLSLFRSLATDLAHRLEIAYPEELDRNIAEFIAKTC